MIDKAILNIQTPRVKKPNPNAQTPRVKKTKSNPKINVNREQIRTYIAAKTMARISQRNTHLQQTTQTSEHAQLIHDEEMNTYLNYRQLLWHPKYSEIGSKSSANKFGRLTNGLKDGRVKGTNTMKFIQKQDVPADRMKDVTYGSFTCDFRPNNAEEN